MWVAVAGDTRISPKLSDTGGGEWGKVGEGGPMFLGEFQHTLDDKGRLTIPARFREGLGDSFVVTRGLDNCLFAYPRSEWQVLESRLKTLPLTKGDARAFVRFLFSGASECELDRQGRVMVPQTLRDHAKVDKDVVVIGVSNRVEIWAKQQWEQYMEHAEGSFEAIAENLEGLGL